MTVKELIDALRELPEELLVKIDNYDWEEGQSYYNNVDGVELIYDPNGGRCVEIFS